MSTHRGSRLPRWVEEGEADADRGHAAQVDCQRVVALRHVDLVPADVLADLDQNRGIAATAMHCVNSIPEVCRAAPGIRTYLELPLVAGRVARDLRT